MRALSISEIQKELKTLPPQRIAELSLRLAKFKKENKELLTYLLFEAGDEESYIKSVKQEITQQFELVNKSNLYLAKKTIRKVLRTVNKYIRYSGIAETEVTLRIYYCTTLKTSGIRLDKSPVLLNLYNNQIKKIDLVLSKLHEDLQFDYSQELSGLRSVK
jgi:hypothetical protein